MAPATTTMTPGSSTCSGSIHSNQKNDAVKKAEEEEKGYQHKLDSQDEKSIEKTTNQKVAPNTTSIAGTQSPNIVERKHTPGSQQEDPALVLLKQEQEQQQKKLNTSTTTTTTTTTTMTISASSKSSSDDDGPGDSGADDDPYLLTQKDIWYHILSFLGPGHFIFIAGVSKILKRFYLEYFNTLKQEEIPKIKPHYCCVQFFYFGCPRVLTCTNTFMPAAFSSVACAKLWDKHTKGSYGRLPDYWVFHHVIKYGDLELLKWAHQQGFPWNTETSEEAADCGRLSIIQYLHENGCPWDEETCAAAAGCGHLDILKYCHQNGCPWNALTCRDAACNGRFDVLCYAHDNGCPWDSETCAWVARVGHLDILQYAHANGCPWDSRTIHWSREHHPEIAQWARNNGCPLPSDEETLAWESKP